MAHSRFTAAGFMLAFGLVLGASCGKEPSTNPSPNPNPAVPTTTSIELVGPQTVAPGATVQFSVIGHRSDGSTLDATRQVTWASNNSFILFVSSTGAVSGRGTGETTITVSMGTLRSTKEVIVVPEGTFRVLGRVMEDVPSASIPVPSAAIQVLTATAGAGRTTFTDGDGRFRFYGIAGNTEIRARKSGYRDQIVPVTITAHQAVDIALTTTAPIPTLAGSYTLTITAAASCRQGLPEAARVRTYAASVAQVDGRNLEVSLGGVTFLNSADHFGGRVEPGVVNFSLGSSYLGFYYYYYYTPSIIERFGADRLSVAGYVVAQASSDRITGLLNGSILVRTDQKVTRGTCYALDHSFELRR